MRPQLAAKTAKRAIAIVFIVLLYKWKKNTLLSIGGGTVLAHYARDHHWNVEADLNNDIIGNSRGGDGTVAADRLPAALPAIYRHVTR